MHYTITLLNKSSNLDLTHKRLAIEQVFQHILNGGVTKRSFKDLHYYKNLHIHKGNIEVNVREAGNSWHPWVGRILANDHGMREYCYGTNKSRMFKWN